jgi:hypothetical protein
MDGTTLDLIIIPIVVMISLAAWLFMVMWADGHPVKTEPRPSAETAEPAGATSGGRAAPGSIPGRGSKPPRNPLSPN